MTERQLFRRLSGHTLAVFVLFVFVTLILNFVCSKNLVEVFDGCPLGEDSSRLYTAADMTAVVENPEIVEVELFNQGVDVYSNVTGLRKGETWVEFQLASTGETINAVQYRVLGNHMVANLSDGNYSNWVLQRRMVLALMIALTIVLWESFHTALKRAGYSYHAIFCSGFGIWLSFADIMIALLLRKNTSMNVLYDNIQKSACDFLMYTFPMVVVFVVLLSISNLFLLRHEGLRGRNVLGIGISIALVVAAVVFSLLYYRDFSGSEFQMHIREAEYSTFASAYCLLECFLLGAIICGTLAARHEPKYDKDYIVILGCKVAGDGTLYPLIRGRVDRAVTFYKNQLEKTGRKAMFVPSGGKGRDESLSEAEAMKRYLLGQGFTEEDILVEDRSRNTMENMKFSKRLIEERTPGAKAAFSTTNFHVFRSGIISRQQDFPAEGMGSKTKWYFWPNAYVREMMGMIRCRWKSLVVMLICLCLFFAFLAFH